MKFIVCQECHEPIFLRKYKRTCECGKSSGKYLEDGLRAVISGPCTAFGISSFDVGLYMRTTRRGVYPDPYDGSVSAWCMPQFPTNIERVETVEES